MKDNIRMARLRKGLLQEEVAEALHISRVAYSNLESGKVRIVNIKVYRLAEYLGVGLEELLLGYSPDPDASWRLQETITGYDVKYKRLQQEFDGRLEDKSAEISTLRELVKSQQKTIASQEAIIKMLKRRNPKKKA